MIDIIVKSVVTGCTEELIGVYTSAPWCENLQCITFSKCIISHKELIEYKLYQDLNRWSWQIRQDLKINGSHSLLSPGEKFQISNFLKSIKCESLYLHPRRRAPPPAVVTAHVKTTGSRGYAGRGRRPVLSRRRAPQTGSHVVTRRRPAPTRARVPETGGEGVYNVDLMLGALIFNLI